MEKDPFFFLELPMVYEPIELFPVKGKAREILLREEGILPSKPYDLTRGGQEDSCS